MDPVLVFEAALAVGKFCMTRRGVTLAPTRLNGVETKVDLSTRNKTAVDFNQISERTRVLAEATQALHDVVRRCDATLELLSLADFKAGWQHLRLAAGATSEENHTRYLARAEEAFVRSFSLLKNERLIAARYGAALAQFQMGEVANGLATLEAVSELAFDSHFANANYYTFLRMKIEARDYLASIGSQPQFRDYWRWKAERFEELASANAGWPAGGQAGNLARATRLLETDFESGINALKTAIAAANGYLNQEGVEVYNYTCAVAFQKKTAPPAFANWVPSPVAPPLSPPPGAGTGFAPPTAPPLSPPPGAGTGFASPTASPLSPPPGAGTGFAPPTASPLSPPSGAGTGFAPPTASPLSPPPGVGTGFAPPVASPFSPPSGAGTGFAPPVASPSQWSNASEPTLTTTFAQDGTNGCCDAVPCGTRYTLTIKGVEFAFRYCPPGTFSMGLIRGASKGVMAFLMTHDDAYKLHRVTLTRGFWMLETPTTQRMYKAIVGTNPSVFTRCEDGGDTLDFPVENVSWEDAQNFLQQLNRLGAQPPGFTFRLPTEAEWEYACRAGTNGNFSFTCSNDGGMRYTGNSSSSQRVGSKCANPWGLLDMHGNVCEWCYDWHANYPAGAAVDPTGPNVGKNRVTRGGSWADLAVFCSSWYRQEFKPTKRGSSIGFRFVLARVS